MPRCTAVRLAGLLLLGMRAAAGALPVPGTDGSVDASGFVDGLAVVAIEDRPRQLPQGILGLAFDASPFRRLRGHLALLGSAGGPFIGGHPGVYNFVHAFQNLPNSLELAEAYAELHLQRAELTAGIQKLAWGKLDGLPPTDVLNPRAYHDPLVRTFEENKVGIPMVVGTYYPPDLSRLGLSGLRATLVYVPIVSPSRLALAEERWFPPTSAPLSRVTLPRASTERLIEQTLGFDVTIPGDIVIPVAFGTANQRPPKQLDAGGIGVRFGSAWRDADWDLYYYAGPWTGPNADLRAALRLDAFSLDPATGQLDVRIRASSELRQAHDTTQMWGGDWATTFRGAAIRAEAAVFRDRPYARPAADLIGPAALGRLPLGRITGQLIRRRRATVPLGDLFVDLDAIEWGVAVDYPIAGFTPLLQVQQTVFFESTPRLLVGDPDTLFIASVRRPLLRDRLELDWRGAYGLTQEAWFLFPRVSYRLRDDVRVSVGFLAVGGSRNSLIGQFKRNDEAVFQVRYTF